MEPRKQSRTRLCIEELENRITPTVLAPIELPAPEAILGNQAHVGSHKSAATPAHDRPFHLEESGQAVMNPDGTISGNASGQATHLGRFTLHDTSTITGVDVTAEGVILHLVGEAELTAANGDKLHASLRGSVNLTTGEGTLDFEWTGGTGRFADATGRTAWQITLNPDLTYSAVAEGVIKY
jgi:hypothetical protein